MDMDRLMESVKKHEGYRNKVYLDTLGKRTVGVGHLCVEDFWEDDKEYEESFLMEILQRDLQEAIRGARELMEERDCLEIDDKAEELIIEFFEGDPVSINDKKMSPAVIMEFLNNIKTRTLVRLSILFSVLVFFSINIIINNVFNSSRIDFTEKKTLLII